MEIGGKKVISVVLVLANGREEETRTVHFDEVHKDTQRIVEEHETREMLRRILQISRPAASEKEDKKKYLAEAIREISGGMNRLRTYRKTAEKEKKPEILAAMRPINAALRKIRIYYRRNF